MTLPWSRGLPDGDATKRFVYFRSLKEKADYLDAMASLDARDPCVRDLARRFSLSCNPNDRACVATRIHDWVRDAVPYVYGPSHQELASAAEVAGCDPQRPAGDNCAGKARLFVAMCRAVELEARILPNFRARGDFNHVQAQVRWPGSEKDPRAEAGGWLRAELIAKGVALGDGEEAVTWDGNGQAVLAGDKAR